MRTNLDYLNGMAGGNQAIIIEMIDLFTEQVLEVSEAMDAALLEKQYEILGKLAHKAKSTVSIMGMTDLATDLKFLEQYASKSLETEKYPEIVNKFKIYCSDAIEELTNHVNSLK